MEPEKVKSTTTVKLSKEAVDFMKTEGKYSETLADIADRLFEELKDLRVKTKNC